MQSPGLEDVLASPHLPSLPAVALEVLELAQRQDTEIRAIARCIERDPALTSRVLRVVNSSYYALRHPCSTIDRALTLLGLSAVRAITLGFSLVDVTRDRDGLDFMGLWRRSLYSAAAARRIATRVGIVDPDEAFAAALMQDIGMLALQGVFPGAYRELQSEDGGRHDELAALERARWGFDHAAAGALLAERWRLPRPICDAIRYHHGTDIPAACPLARTAAIGAGIVTAMESEHRYRELRSTFGRAAEWMDLTPDDLTRLLDATVADGAQLADLFVITLDRAPDIGAVLLAAEQVQVRAAAAMSHRIAELESLNSQLRQRAELDTLTGTVNRAFFDRELAMRLDQATTFNGSLGLVLLDLDHFQGINDEYGRPVGDTILKAAALRFREVMGDRGDVARIGDDEFAVLIPGATEAVLESLADRLRTRISESAFPLLPDEEGEADTIVERPGEDAAAEAPGTSDGARIRLTTSAGAVLMVSAPDNPLTLPSLLMQAADRALRAAKNAGRNCIRIFRAHPRPADRKAG